MPLYRRDAGEGVIDLFGETCVALRLLFEYLEATPDITQFGIDVRNLILYLIKSRIHLIESDIDLGEPLVHLRSQSTHLRAYLFGQVVVYAFYKLRQFLKLIVCHAGYGTTAASWYTGWYGCA